MHQANKQPRSSNSLESESQSPDSTQAGIDSEQIEAPVAEQSADKLQVTRQAGAANSNAARLVEAHAYAKAPSENVGMTYKIVEGPGALAGAASVHVSDKNRNTTGVVNSSCPLVCRVIVSRVRRLFTRFA